MKKIIALCAFAVLTMACSSKKEGNMLVQGQIKGLKKGTLYLQKMVDGALVSVDSISLLGDETYTLTDNVTEPEAYVVTFDGNANDKSIVFFGEQGTITINDRLDQFGYQPEITGSKNQVILDKFQVINKKFKEQRLNFIKQEFDAKVANDTALTAEIAAGYKRMIRRRYLFTTNFAVTNPDSEVAPYLALTELYDANVQLLDTINNALTDRVKNSKYGKKLHTYISEIKATE